MACEFHSCTPRAHSLNVKDGGGLLVEKDNHRVWAKGLCESIGP